MQTTPTTYTLRVQVPGDTLTHAHRVASAADLAPLLPRRDRKRAGEIHAGILRWFEQREGDADLSLYAYPDRPTWANR